MVQLLPFLLCCFDIFRWLCHHPAISSSLLHTVLSASHLDPVSIVNHGITGPDFVRLIMCAAAFLSAEQ